MRIRSIGMIVALTTSLLIPQSLEAHQGDRKLERAVYQAANEPAGKVGDSNSRAVAQAIVDAAGSTLRASGSTLLPPGSVVDRSLWNGTLLEIDLTLAGDHSDWVGGGQRIRTPGTRGH